MVNVPWRAAARRLTASLAIGMLAGSLVMAGPGTAQAPRPAETAVAGAVPVGPGVRVVTLVTGDQVQVRADGTLVTVTPGQGREGVPIPVLHQDGHLVVMPADAARLVAEGRLDPRLFDVTTLLELGYDDAARGDLPLLVTGALPGPRRTALATAGARLSRELPSIGGVAARLRKRDAADFWAATTTAEGAASLALRSGVERVWLDGLTEVALDESVPQIGAPTAHLAGLDGTGVTVAVLDSGIDASHPDLASQVAAAQDFTGEGITSEDPNGHGTHVASTIAGTGTASSGQFTGVAFGAELLNGRVCDEEGHCPDSAVIAGMEWAAMTQGADVVNLSLGGPDTEDISPVEAAINQLTAAHGTLFVVAAGNDGATVGSPGSADAALTVGAVTKQDELAGFSGRGPRIGDGALKPDITGPGVDITAAFSSQAGGGPGQRYVLNSGTSMATPHVAGAAAILKQQHPTWTATELKAALMASAEPAAGVSAYDQGAGRVDVAQGIDTLVTADPPSVSFGRPVWPHDDDLPTVETVTFHNHDTAPVNLSLSLTATDPEGNPAPAGMFSLGASAVTVPAGGTAGVTVTADTSVTGPDGHYTGRIAASAGGGEVAAVPFAVDREVESYDLTLRHLDRTGALTAEYTTAVSSRVDAPRTLFRYDPDGELTIRLPVGSYHVSSLITTGSGSSVQFTMLVHPQVEITADTTVDLDAQLGQPLDVTVPEPGADLVGGFLGYMLDATFGGTGGGWSLSDTLNGLFSAHLGPALTVNDMAGQFLGVFAEPGPPGDVDEFFNSPYVYNLGWIQDGQFFTGIDEDVANAELAAFETTYAAQTETTRYGWQRTDIFPLVNRFGWVTMSFFTGFELPATRTEFFTTENLLWNRVMLETTPPEDGLVEVSTLQHARQDLAPGNFQDRWNAGPFVPALLNPDGSARWVSRTGDRIDVDVPVFGDQSGHNGYSATTSGRTALFREGTLVAETTNPGFGQFPVPGAAAEYELVVEATRDTSNFATSVESAWTFTSGTTPASPPTRLPLMAARYRPALDEQNRAPSGAAFSFPLVVDHQPFAPASTVTSLTVDVSYDDGTTWQPASVSGSGDSYLVSVTHPAGDGYVSLRTQATDAAGNTMDQAVIRAYRLGAAEPPPPPVDLRAQYQVANASDITNQISNNLQLVNDGDVAVPLPDVTVRYWYTSDGSQPQQYNCDFAAIGCATIAGDFVTLGGPLPSADAYLELSFTSGTLAAAGSTGPIQNRWHKTDWTNYQQSNDYSFDPTITTLTDWPLVTVYFQEQLVWGTEP